MAIDSIGSASYSAAQSISSGNRINSAADDASGLAISEKMESQIRGLEQGNDNTLDMQNLIKTAEGGLANIADSLQRIRELTLQAANGIYNDSDRRIIQNEIDQMMQGISNTANNVQFNNKNLLNGDAQNLHTASNPDGSGMTVNIPDMTTLAKDLIEKLNVVNGNMSDNFQLIDNALSQVNAARGELGAISNRMDHTINSNSITMLNQAAAKSRIADADMAKETMNFNREQILNDVKLLMQKQQQEQEKTKVMHLQI